MWWMIIYDDFALQLKKKGIWAMDVYVKMIFTVGLKSGVSVEREMEE